MGEAAPSRSAAMIWAWRSGVILALIGLGAGAALLIMRKWWPERYLALLPTPALVIREVTAIGYFPLRTYDSLRSLEMVSFDRFPREAVTTALVQAISVREPGPELIDLAREWAVEVRGQKGAIVRGFQTCLDTAPVATRKRVREACWAITAQPPDYWVDSMQEQDGGWPVGSVTLGPGRWRPGRAAVTAIVLLLWAEAGHDQRSPGPLRDSVRAGLALLLASQDADGRCAVDLRDHAWVASALIELYAMTSDPGLRAPAQRALDRAHRDLSETGGYPWDKDTLLAALQLRLRRFAAQSGLETGQENFDPGEALRRRWAADNPDPAKPAYFPWREGGEIVASGDQDGLAAALDGFCLVDHDGTPGNFAVLASAHIAGCSAQPRAWSPIGFFLASMGMSSLRPPEGTAERRWLEQSARSDLGAYIGQDPVTDTWTSAGGRLCSAASGALLETCRKRVDWTVRDLFIQEKTSGR